MKWSLALVSLILMAFGSQMLALSQSPTPLSLTINNDKEPERAKRFWKFSMQFTATNEAETANKTKITRSPMTNYTASFENVSGEREYTLETSTGVAMSKFNNDRYLSFRVAALQKFSHDVNLTGDVEFSYTNYNSYGRSGISLSKGFSAKKDSAGLSKSPFKLIEPFTKVDYYFSLGNVNRNNQFEKAGLVWSNGLNSEVKLGNFVFENTSQFMLDSGAIISGRRTLFDSEMNIGYRMNKVCFGPMFEYTRLLVGKFPQRSSFISGMFVRFNSPRDDEEK